MRTHRTVRLTLCLTVLAGAACNPTWTKEGKPNDSSMPVPPGGSAPKQVGGSGQQAQPAAAGDASR